MTTLFDIIHELRKNPQKYNGKIIKGPFWPNFVEILTIVPQSNGFMLFFRSIQNNDAGAPKILYPEQLKEITLIDQDFGGNARLFFLAMMGHIIRNNYESDPFFAVGISNIDPLPHQLDAVYNYILPRGQLRFMIADDPGAGKTIMAGLVIKEYLYRGLAKRILIICPGGLTTQWEEEIRNKFSEDFLIVNRGLINAYKNRNVWEEYNKLIVSMDFAKQTDVLNSLNGINWDLIIVDEAHKFSGRVKKEVFQPNMRYQLGKIISTNTLNLLFLTATMHKGDNQVYRMLLSLLEPDIFGDEYINYAPDVDDQVLELEKGGIPIFIRRLKESMVDLEKKPLFKKRRSDTITWSISEMETDVYRAVSNYVKENFNKALKNKQTTVAFALKIMQRRLLSSSHAIYKTLANRADRLQGILDNDEFKKSKNELKKMEQEYLLKLEVEWDDLSESERMKIEKELLKVSMAQNPDELKEEISLLRNLQHLAEELKNNPSQETKLWELKKLLDTHLKDLQEKILIFTEFTDTLRFVEEHIKQWGYSVSIIHGGMNMEDRKEAQREFKKNNQILVATEAAGEGINLQFCHLLINYDIPWSPTRLEQRLGRIHRYGQKNDCYFFNLISNRAADGKPIAEGEVLAALLRKIEVIQKSLGNDRVYDMIGDQIFNELSLDSVFEIVKNDPNGFFKIKNRIESDELEENINSTLVKARANMTVNLHKIKESTIISEETRLWPEYIENYVQIFLEFFGGKITKSKKIIVPTILREHFRELKKNYINVTFNKPESNIFDEEDVSNYISLGHPLLENMIDLSIEQSGIDLRRGAIFLDSSNYGTGILWFIDQSIEDGNNRPLGKTVGLIFQPLNENMELLQPKKIPILKLWDFEPLTQDSEVKFDVKFDQYQEDAVKFFYNEHGKVFFTRVKEENNRFIEIQKKTAKKAFDHQRGYLLKLISQFRKKLKSIKTSLDDNNQPSKQAEKFTNKIKRAQKQRDNLQKRFSLLQEELDRRDNITHQPAKVIGLALVIPADEAGNYDKEFMISQKKREKKIRELTDKKVIDEAAMKIVLRYEDSQGRETRDVSNINCGYDIESKDPKTLKIRRIEVKGHTSTEDTLISNNEFKMGLRHSNSFWLYVVEYALSNPKLRIIQNPALTLFENLKEIQSKNYIISHKDIERYSEFIEDI